MSTFDRYLLREWLKFFGLMVAATLGILVVQVTYAELRELLDLEASAGEVALFYAVSIPAYLGYVVPISLLLSLLYVLGKMHRNHETTALRAAGVSVGRMTRWLWVSGLLLSAGMFYLNSTLIPWSVEEGRAIRDRLEFAKQARSRSASEVGLAFNLAFDNQRDRRIWLFNRFSRFTLKGSGLTVSQLDPLRREQLRLQAREAYRDPAQRGWVLLEGRETQFDPQTGETLFSRVFERRVMTAWTEDPETMFLLGRRAKDLSLWELQELLGRFTAVQVPKWSSYAVRYHALLAGTLGCLIVVGLAVPFAISGVRVNPAVGVSKSIGLFFAYYILLNLGTLWGERGVIEPWLAAWLPNLGMLALAGHFFLRLR